MVMVMVMVIVMVMVMVVMMLVVMMLVVMMVMVMVLVAMMITGLRLEKTAAKVPINSLHMREPNTTIQVKTTCQIWGADAMRVERPVQAARGGVRSASRREPCV